MINSNPRNYERDIKTLIKDDGESSYMNVLMELPENFAKNKRKLKSTYLNMYETDDEKSVKAVTPIKDRSSGLFKPFDPEEFNFTKSYEKETLFNID